MSEDLDYSVTTMQKTIVGIPYGPKVIFHDPETSGVPGVVEVAAGPFNKNRYRVDPEGVRNPWVNDLIPRAYNNDVPTISYHDHGSNPDAVTRYQAYDAADSKNFLTVNHSAEKTKIHWEENGRMRSLRFVDTLWSSDGNIRVRSAQKLLRGFLFRRQRA